MTFSRPKTTPPKTRLRMCSKPSKNWLSTMIRRARRPRPRVASTTPSTKSCRKNRWDLKAESNTLKSIIIFSDIQVKPSFHLLFKCEFIAKHRFFKVPLLVIRKHNAHCIAVNAFKSVIWQQFITFNIRTFFHFLMQSQLSTIQSELQTLRDSTSHQKRRVNEMIRSLLTDLGKNLSCNPFSQYWVNDHLRITTTYLQRLKLWGPSFEGSYLWEQP